MVRSNEPTRALGEGREHLKAFESYPETVINVGVLWGTPALYRAFSKGKFFLFEPQAEYEGAIKKLSRQYAMSYEMSALGATPGEGEFFAKPKDPGASIAFPEAGAISAFQRRTVPMRRLDGALRADQLGRSCLLKIDCPNEVISRTTFWTAHIVPKTALSTSWILSF